MFFEWLLVVLQGTYWTIHITPEPEFSYVSFETNLSQTSYDDLVRKVVEVFKPGKFVTTLFVNQVRTALLAFTVWTCNCSLSRTCVLPSELQMSQCLLLRPETGGVQARRPAVGPVQRLQLCLYQLRPEPPAEPAELRPRNEKEA